MPTPHPEYEYVLDNKWHAARQRLALYGAIYDAWTIRNLEALGVGSGWHCCEVAGGGGSIAQWLCERVGPTGYVLATDLEPHLLEAITAPNLDVQRHDILVDALPEAAFDLVHTRALLTFLPDQVQALQQMVAAVKPGGWLLVEEPDWVSAVPDPTMDATAIALSQKGWEAMHTVVTGRGYDAALGRRLYQMVSTTGLVEVSSEGFTAMQLGGTPTAQFWRVTFEQLRDQVLERGLLSPSELEAYCTLLEQPGYRWLSATMMSAWGRRPAG
jgi:ubiquinone/menaquinone biosynthesis C-methylase UbiE